MAKQQPKQQIKQPVLSSDPLANVYRFADVTHFVWMLRTNELKLVVQSMIEDSNSKVITEERKEFLAHDDNLVNALNGALIHDKDRGVSDPAYKADPNAYLAAHPEVIGEYELFTRIKLKDLIPSLSGLEGEILIVDLLKGMISNQITQINNRGRF